MTTIQGIIKDSAGVLLNAQLRITLDAPVSDTSTTPDTTYLPVSVTKPITAGSLAVDVVETATANTTVFFELYTEQTQYSYFFLDGEAYVGPVHLHTDGKYYTGETHNSDSVELARSSEIIESIIQAFRAIVPNQSTVDWADLIPTGVSVDVLDTGLRRLAEILTSSTDYVEALRGGPRWLGDYNAATIYQRDDAVAYGGSSWLYINADPSSGNTPVDGIYWTKIAQKGDPGSTGGAAGAYDATGWLNDSNAPTKAAIRNLVEGSLAKLSNLTGLAPLASPSFSGSPNAPTPANNSNSTAIATTAFVQGNFAPLTNPAFAGNPTAPTQAAGNNTPRLATTAFVQGEIQQARFYAHKTTTPTLTNNTWNTITFDVESLDTANAFNPATGIFTAPSAGWYEFNAMTYVVRTGGTNMTIAGAFLVGGSLRHAIFDRTLSNQDFGASGSTWISLAAGATVAFQVYSSSDGSVALNLPASNIRTRFLGQRLIQP
ncbi:MAG TPA: hypothetical protein V6D06_10725 [Trichocoleus sp.]